MNKNMGASADADRAAAADAVEPVPVSSKASIPSAIYDTYVFCSINEDASRRLFTELQGRFPFADRRAETRMSAWSAGDALSVSDAVRMALESRALDCYERVDLALEMEASGSWEACIAKAAEWDLAECDGEFVEAQGTEAWRAETGTGSVHDGPVTEGDAL